MFFKKANTVDGIMNSFAKQVKQLRDLSKAKADEGNALATQAADLRKQATVKDIQAGDAFMEGTRADAMASKIEDFITV